MDLTQTQEAFLVLDKSLKIMLPDLNFPFSTNYQPHPNFNRVVVDLAKLAAAVDLVRVQEVKAVADSAKAAAAVDLVRAEADSVKAVVAAGLVKAEEVSAKAVVVSAKVAGAEVSAKVAGAVDLAKVGAVVVVLVGKLLV